MRRGRSPDPRINWHNAQQQHRQGGSPPQTPQFSQQMQDPRSSFPSFHRAQSPGMAPQVFMDQHMQQDQHSPPPQASMHPQQQFQPQQTQAQQQYQPPLSPQQQFQAQFSQAQPPPMMQQQMPQQVPQNYPQQLLLSSGYYSQAQPPPLPQKRPSHPTFNVIASSPAQFPMPASASSSAAFESHQRAQRRPDQRDSGFLQVPD